MLKPDETYSIGRMCAAFDVTPRTLRFYEDKGLLSPQRDGLRRLYGARERARLTLILRGKRFGFSLEEIRELLSLYDTGDGQVRQLTETLAAARGKLAAMTSQRDELTAAIADLAQQIVLIERLLAERAKA
jgi:DNA-binding transcriptional MerR regulator